MMGSLFLQNPGYHPLFSIMIYCDILFGIWGLVPDLNRRLLLRLSVLLLPIPFYFIPSTSDLAVPLFLSGIILSILFNRVFYRIRYCFSVSEVILFCKWTLILLALLFSDSTPIHTQIAIVVVLLSTILTHIVLVLCNKQPRIKQSPLAVYALIVAGASIEIAALSHLVQSPFVPWFASWLFQLHDDGSSFQLHDDSSSLNWSRPLFLLYWFAVIVAMCWCLGKGLFTNQPQIIQRKFFHLVAVVLFLPALLTDAPFMQYASRHLFMIRVAFAFAYLVFLLLEIVRINSVPPFTSLDAVMRAFVDSRDAGPLLLTHFSLLLSCAAPSWVLCNSQIACARIARLSGVLSVGVGDACVGDVVWIQCRRR